MRELIKRNGRLLAGLLLLSLLAACAAPKYEPQVTVRKPVDRLHVYLRLQDNATYQVQVVNESRHVVSLVWNESVYVNTAGDATRLIHVERTADLDHAPTPQQAPSVIGPHGRLQTEFVGESWIDYARRGVMPRPRESDRKAKIYLSFRMKHKQMYWRAEVRFVLKK